MKKILSSIFILCIIFATFACTKKVENTKVEKGEEKIMNYPKVEISVKDFGVMQFELDPENAPITVANFLKLTESGFYDGLTFHRIIRDFMIQGGDPTGTGMGGSDENIKGEFSANNVDNKIEHLRGVISMARSTEMDSASSQFFICHQDATFLDGQYAAFGKIISGIEVVDKICEEVRVLDDNGTVKKVEQPVIEYVKIISK